MDTKSPEKSPTPDQLATLALTANELFSNHSQKQEFQTRAWQAFYSARDYGLVWPEEAQPVYNAGMPLATRAMLSLVWDRAVERLEHVSPDLYVATQAQARQFCFARD